MTMELAISYGLSGNEILYAIKKALVHDIPEIQLSDIPHPTKKLIESHMTSGSMDKIENDILQQILGKQLANQTFGVVNTKLADLIVLKADIMSVFQFAQTEKQLGNTMVDHLLLDVGMRMMHVDNEIQNEIQNRNEEAKNAQEQQANTSETANDNQV